jgi:hypothetical protein
MTNAERNARILKAIREYTEENMATPELARATLIREGFYTEDGKLRPEYGGEIETAEPTG